MLLGLMAAVMLAVLLQLNAQRSSRSDASEFASGGVIELRCWVVVDTPVCVASRPILALPAPRRPAEPLRFIGEMQMLGRPPARRPVRKPLIIRVVGIRMQPHDPIIIPRLNPYPLPVHPGEGRDPGQVGAGFIEGSRSSRPATFRQRPH